jgi:MFS family permease
MPMAGKISDLYGRKKVFGVSYLGSGRIPLYGAAALGFSALVPPRSA